MNIVITCDSVCKTEEMLLPTLEIVLFYFYIF
jgi:hypothetical protein